MTDGTGSTPRSKAQAEPAYFNPARDRRRKTAAIAILLVLSASGFCALVVWHRDAQLKTAAMDWAETTQAWFQAYIDERGYLPFELSPDLPKAGGPFELQYPNIEQVTRLRDQTGPYVLVAGPRQGLITPGADGCAAVIYDHGKIRVEWMTRSEIETAEKQRQSWLGQ